MSAPAPVPKADVRPLRILCADDNEILGDVMLCLFAKVGHWVEHVDDGLQAWERISQDLGDFDVVITDHQMPGLTGLELVELLRQANFLGALSFTAQRSPPTRLKAIAGSEWMVS